LHGPRTMREPSARRSWMDVVGAPSSTPSQGCPPAVGGVAAAGAAPKPLPDGPAASPAPPPQLCRWGRVAGGRASAGAGEAAKRAVTAPRSLPCRQPEKCRPAQAAAGKPPVLSLRCRLSAAEQSCSPANLACTCLRRRGTQAMRRTGQRAPGALEGLVARARGRLVWRVAAHEVDAHRLRARARQARRVAGGRCGRPGALTRGSLV